MRPKRVSWDLSEISTAAPILTLQHLFCLSHSVKGPQSTHPWCAPLFSSLQLATGTSCNKLSNLTVLSQSHHSKTAWGIVVSTFLPFVLLSVPNKVLTMFCAAAMLCCCYVDVMLCCHVFLPCYVGVLGLSLYSVVVPAGDLLPFGQTFFLTDLSI